MPAPDNQFAEFFPLLPWNFTIWNKPLVSPALFAEMRECGLTMAGFVRAEELDTVHAAGLKAIIYDERLSDHDWKNVNETDAREKVKHVISKVRDHPAVYGYYLKDEPSADDFEGLTKLARIVKELHPGAWPYINLFPNYATSEQLGTATYEEHLEKFVAICDPPIVSYDHYALMEAELLQDGYFRNLEQIRSITAKTNRPFWNIIQSVALIMNREVNAADLRFQVYTTLAYGGRGISYFTYITPHVGNFRMAPLDQFGNRTSTWHPMQNISLQIANLGPTFLKLKHHRVYHFGKVPSGCSSPPADSWITDPNEPHLIGEFFHADGSRYVLIVNVDLAHSHGCAPSWREQDVPFQMVSPYTGKMVAYEGEQKFLAPGARSLIETNPVMIRVTEAASNCGNTR